MMGLTPNQLQALEFIRWYVTARGVAPSYEEIAAGVGITSRHGAFRLVKMLIERGAVRRMPGRARAIEIIEPWSVTLSRQVGPQVEAYARQHRISLSTAASELLGEYLAKVA
jgi:SOS-response transcriptional repressor LexA